jgi:gliding motility-associated-like protein
MNRLLIAIAQLHPNRLQRVLLIALLLVNTGFLCGQTLGLPPSAGAVQLGDLDVPGNQVTVEALIFMGTYNPGGNIVSKHFNPLNVNYLLRPLTFELSTYVNGNSGPTRFLQMINPHKLLPNRWYHVAGTYDGARVKYYVNGCLVIDSAFSGNLCQNNNIAAIGNRSSCACEQFSGKIDEVRIWKTARTQYDIAQNMLTLPNPRSQPGLLACYTFNGNFTNSQGNTVWNGIKNGSAALAPGEPFVQAFEVTGIQANNADCDKVNNGQITIMTNRPDARYSIDGLHYQDGNIFPALKAGNYTAYAKDPGGCLLTNQTTVGNNHQFIRVDTAASLCRNNSYLGYAAAGIYTDTLPASTGCDTIRTIHLTETQRSIVDEKRTICEGAAYMGHQQTGLFADTLVAANGCDSIRRLELTVIKPPAPDLGSSRAICRGDSIRLSPGRFDAYTWQDGTQQEALTVTNSGFYSVEVSNRCGVKQQQVMITDGRCGLFFPTAFSPNGDGINDEFKPLAFNLSNFHWKIFNRFGQLVFETGDIYRGWDGKVNGQVQQAGVFIWTCRYTKNSMQQEQKGSLVLIR